MIMKLSSAHILSRAIHVAACLNIADHLKNGLRDIETLAKLIGADEQALYRLMRLLSSHAIFYEDEQARFCLTPLAEPLLSDHSDSLRDWLAYHDGDEKRWQAYGAMEYSVRTGEPAFNHLFGAGYFDLLAQDPSQARKFDEGMKNLSADEDAHCIASYDFSAIKTVIDIGGGMGGLLAETLSRYPTMHGVLYEMPHVIAAVEKSKMVGSFGERLSLQRGSFFDGVPQGADLYLLKRVLHDWDDADCVTILKQCAQAMNPGARLLILEAITKGPNLPDFVKEVDIAMMVLFGGKERTQQEWESLLTTAGLKIMRVLPTKTMLSIIEVVQENSPVAVQ